MSGLRILQIAHDHPDWTPGGTEFIAHALTGALRARAGQQASLLVAATALQRPDDAPGTLGLHGADHVLRTGRYDSFSMLRQDGTEWVGALRRLLDNLRPDVVHLHGVDRIGAEVLAVIRRALPRTRIVLTLHDYQLLCPRDGLMVTAAGALCPGPMPDRCRSCIADLPAAAHVLRKAHLMALLSLVDGFVAPSRFLAQRFADWGIAAGRITVLPNAVPPMSVPPTTERGRLAYFGNIAPHKGILTLLAAAKLAGAGVSLDLHGGLLHPDPAFRAAFEAGLAAAPNVQHCGTYGRDELAGRMERADWVVMPSLWWENAPLVLLEARAAGRPVICSGIGGMAELVEDGVTGLHVPPGDARALAAAMTRAASDPGLQARLAAGQALRHRDGAFEDFVSAHLDLYNRLTGGIPA